MVKKRGQFFTDVGKDITKSATGATIRTYNKSHAEKAYANLVAPKTLDVQALAAASKEMNQSAMEKHAEYVVQTVNIDGKDEPLFLAFPT